VLVAVLSGLGRTVAAGRAHGVATQTQSGRWGEDTARWASTWSLTLSTSVRVLSMGRNSGIEAPSATLPQMGAPVGVD
jgi:hypothetical protein